MDNAREKLVELLMQVEDNMCDDCGREPVGCAVVAIADHLLANGVTVQECIGFNGKWIVKGQEVFCSNCNKESGYNAWGASAFSDYCPNCGKKMMSQPPKKEE